MIAHEQYRIAVLMGGVSKEREVSLHSGEAIAQGLQQAGQIVELLELHHPALPHFSWHEFDLAFIALHGTFGEDGHVQQLLEQRGVSYTGSGVEASRNAMDKLTSKLIFNVSRVPIPPFVYVPAGLALGKLRRRLQGLYPVVVKPRAQGSSIGVSIVWNPDGLREAVAEARAVDADLLVESYIAGRELTVGILRDQPLPIIELQPRRAFFDYQAKYQKGQTEYIVDPPLSDRAKTGARRLALAAYRALGCEGFARVDMILGNDLCLYVLELNSIPGFTETSLLPKAALKAGIAFPELCYTIVEGSLEGARLSLVAS